MLIDHSDMETRKICVYLPKSVSLNREVPTEWHKLRCKSAESHQGGFLSLAIALNFRRSSIWGSVDRWSARCGFSYNTTGV